MPLSDGTSTASEIGRELNRLLVAFKPNHKPGDPLWDLMCVEYADALRRFPPHSLKAGISKLIAERRDKFWPTPAEIIEATMTAQVPNRIGAERPKDDDWRARLRAEDERAREARKSIVADFERRNAVLYRAARSGGWIGSLDTAVRAAANILEQRDAKRRKGEAVQYPCDFPDSKNPHIITIDRQEEISIPPSQIETWRIWQANPTADHLRHVRSLKSLGGVAKRIVDDLPARATELAAE